MSGVRVGDAGGGQVERGDEAQAAAQAAGAGEAAEAAEAPHDHAAAAAERTHMVAEESASGITRQGSVEHAAVASGIDRVDMGSTDEDPAVAMACAVGSLLNAEGAAAEEIERLADTVADANASAGARLEAAEALLLKAGALLGRVAETMESTQPEPGSAS